ncbi:hypothetical protein BDY19DRAFT_902049 [Irpex rosettiformis]|uniref:Uncharacterized protein n=1 Tax=Irpex rosettiformis TaxID=378272 RepID=A0ACB8UKN3_9APHY|nr:hypothetical protein BDY19DRAFT_902049 [Irpex rosettiformis]
MTTAPAHALPWTSLPTEMKFSVIQHLDAKDIRSFAKVNKEAYTLAVPALWRVVDLQSLDHIISYADNVPQSYHRYTRQLSICTKPANSGAPTNTAISDALSRLLASCTQIDQLSLTLEASLDYSLVHLFQHLDQLKALSIHHCGDEQRTPLSERLVVSIAASVPNLQELSLDRIARSALHAPELIGAYPFVPVVTGDADIPDHPRLGSDLSLPSLLRLPTLRKLKIRDTHLGDPKWCVTPISCSLEFLDLGSYCNESPEFNRVCTERIVGTVGHAVDEFSLNTALSGETYAFEKPKETPLKKLRKVHLTPLFPVENVVDTLTTLSGSPVEELSVRCYEDDVLDMCSALEDFLSLRTERGDSDFYKHLSQISVSTVTDIYSDDNAHDDVHDIFTRSNAGDCNCSSISPRTRPTVVIPAEHALAIQRLQEFCHDLALAGSCSHEELVIAKGMACMCENEN